MLGFSLETAPAPPLAAIGGSAGALPALLELIPAGFPGALLVLAHLPPGRRSHLPGLLGRATTLTVGPAGGGVSARLRPTCTWRRPAATGWRAALARRFRMPARRSQPGRSTPFRLPRQPRSS